MWHGLQGRKARRTSPLMIGTTQTLAQCSESDTELLLETRIQNYRRSRLAGAQQIVLSYNQTAATSASGRPVPGVCCQPWARLAFLPPFPLNPAVIIIFVWTQSLLKLPTAELPVARLRKGTKKTFRPSPMVLPMS